MPITGTALLIAVAAAGTWFMGHEIVKGAKKVAHETKCVVTTTHKCPVSKK